MQTPPIQLHNTLKQALTKYSQIETQPGLIEVSDSDSAGYLLVVDDKVRVALVIIEDDINLGVHPVVNTGVIEVTGGITRVDRGRSPHRRISYSKPASKDFGQKHAVDSFG